LDEENILIRCIARYHSGFFGKNLIPLLCPLQEYKINGEDVYRSMKWREGGNEMENDEMAMAMAIICMTYLFAR
jgi:hypothetical protein